jgi:hypothetical protein
VQTHFLTATVEATVGGFFVGAIAGVVVAEAIAGEDSAGVVG